MEDNEDIVFYCSRCCSLHIIEGKNGVLTCGSCGAGPKHIDVTSFERWERLYVERNGHKLVEKTSIYDDLMEVYEDDTPTIITASEALSNGIRVGDVINRKIDE